MDSLPEHHLVVVNFLQYDVCVGHIGWAWPREIAHNVGVLK